MKSKRNKKLSFCAITLGLIQCLIYLYNYIFIDYFSSIGLAESLSTFGYSLLLIIAGVINLGNSSLGRPLLWSFVIGSILERIVVVFLYRENISIDIFILPITSSIIIGMLLYFLKNGYTAYKRNYVIIAAIISGLIGLLPKIL